MKIIKIICFSVLFSSLTSCINVYYRYTYISKDKKIKIHADVDHSSDKNTSVVLNIYFTNLNKIDSVKAFNPITKKDLIFDSKLEGCFIFTDMSYDSLIQNNFIIVSVFNGKNKVKFILNRNVLKDINMIRGH
jgi:hypothetical protein